MNYLFQYHIVYLSFKIYILCEKKTIRRYPQYNTIVTKSSSVYCQVKGSGYELNVNSFFLWPTLAPFNNTMIFHFVYVYYKLFSFIFIPITLNKNKFLILLLTLTQNLQIRHEFLIEFFQACIFKSSAPNLVIKWSLSHNQSNFSHTSPFFLSYAKIDFIQRINFYFLIISI